MVELRAMDPDYPIQNQLSAEAGPVVLVNLFMVQAEQKEALLKAWQRDALFMQKQPGYISTQLHKAIGESNMFLNYAIWESVEAFRNAFSQPEFQNALKDYPSSAVAMPHLFEKIAVENCCTA